MWTCPECGKRFRNKNQWHSCYRLTIEDHLKNKSENVQNAVLLLIGKIESFGPMQLNPVKSSIQVKAGATFLSIWLKTDIIKLDFQLGHKVDDFPIHRVIRISGKRYLHSVYIQESEDLDETLLVSKE
jgi:hypothetical protein